jgi:hypothetical protein
MKSVKHWDDNQAFSALLIRLNKAIADEFKTLLEQKHVYQRVAIDVSMILSETKQDLSSAYRYEFETRLQKLPADLPFPRKNSRFLKLLQASLHGSF